MIQPHEITLGRGVEIYLDTPVGLVRITRIEGRRVLIEAPEQIAVSRGIRRAAEDARFVKVIGDEGVKPGYAMLVPKLDARGFLDGVQIPTVLKIGDSNGK